MSSMSASALLQRIRECHLAAQIDEAAHFTRRLFEEYPFEDPFLITPRRNAAFWLISEYLKKEDTVNAELWALAGLRFGPCEAFLVALADAAMSKGDTNAMSAWIAAAKAIPADKTTYAYTDAYPFIYLKGIDTLANTTAQTVCDCKVALDTAVFERRLFKYGAAIHFTVIVPVRNAEKYIQRCLESIAFQQYSNTFDVRVCDDASTDNTAAIAREFCQSHNNFQFRQNAIQQGAVANVVTNLADVDPLTVVVQVDGDDFLAYADVLERVALEYRQGAWMTYGSAITTAGVLFHKEGYSAAIALENSFRKHPFLYTHLHTFVGALFHKIRSESFRDASGEWLRYASDVVIATPMLEMAGISAKYMPDILYVYNNQNPQGDSQLARQSQDATHRFVFAQLAYEPLEVLL